MQIWCKNKNRFKNKEFFFLNATAARYSQKLGREIIADDPLDLPIS